MTLGMTPLIQTLSEYEYFMIDPVVVSDLYFIAVVFEQVVLKQ